MVVDVTRQGHPHGVFHAVAVAVHVSGVGIVNHLLGQAAVKVRGNRVEKGGGNEFGIRIIGQSVAVLDVLCRPAGEAFGPPGVLQGRVKHGEIIAVAVQVGPPGVHQAHLACRSEQQYPTALLSRHVHPVLGARSPKQRFQVPIPGEEGVEHVFASRAAQHLLHRFNADSSQAGIVWIARPAFPHEGSAAEPGAPAMVKAEHVPVRPHIAVEPVLRLGQGGVQ